MITRACELYLMVSLPGICFVSFGHKILQGTSAAYSPLTPSHVDKEGHQCLWVALSSPIWGTPLTLVRRKQVTSTIAPLCKRKNEDSAAS